MEDETPYEEGMCLMPGNRLNGETLGVVAMAFHCELRLEFELVCGLGELLRVGLDVVGQHLGVGRAQSIRYPLAVFRWD